MQTPSYESVDHILEEVRAMHVRGGSAFGQAAALAFKLVAQDDDLSTIDALFTELDRVAEALLAEKPTMATIHNAKALIVEAVRTDGIGVDVGRLKALIIGRADHFVQYSRAAVDRLGAVGANLVQDGQTVMMHSYSTSVMSVFRRARNAGADFDVVCTESRPLYESRYAVDELTEMGVAVTLVTDASMAEAARGANWIITGADSVAVDGTVANKMGTNLLSIVAERYDIPYYVATEVLKLQPATRRGHPIALETRPASEMVDTERFSHPDLVTVRNQFFDLTPAQRIHALVTEQGLYAPQQIGQAWRDVEANFETINDER